MKTDGLLIRNALPSFHQQVPRPRIGQDWSFHPRRPDQTQRRSGNFNFIAAAAVTLVAMTQKQWSNMLFEVLSLLQILRLSQRRRTGHNRDECQPQGPTEAPAASANRSAPS